MKNKKMFLLIIIFVLLILVYFGIKAFFLYAYNTSKLTGDNYYSIEKLKEAFDNKEVITIEHNDILEEDYFQFEDLKIRNDFELYNEHNKLYKFKNNDILVGFNKNSSDYLVSTVKENSKNIGLFYNLTHDLEKNNINTNYKLYEYLLENVNQELNIFTSIHNLRKSQAINLSSLIIFNSVDEVVLINGDYDGYILKNNNSTSIFIEYDNNYYSIIFYGHYSDDDLYKLISTIEFD